MKFNPQKLHRRSIRLKEYNWSRVELTTAWIERYNTQYEMEYSVQILKKIPNGQTH